MSYHWFYYVLFSFCCENALFAQPSFSVESSLVLLHAESGREKVVLKRNGHFEAPNWSPNGKYLIINSGGRLEKISVRGQELGMIDTGFADQCNNDHGFAPDGRTLIISHNDNRVAEGLNSRIFTIPIHGGEPKLITEKYPSYWHGVSPDGKTLLYCAYRNSEWDIYSILISGGEETQLTGQPGLDDGPEFSTDGNWIYFNSNRSGRMHIYRMKADGSNPEQLTFDEYDNWFPHISPRGDKLAYISYLEDQNGRHPFGKDVKLRLLNLNSGRISDITNVFYGGQGSFNVNSWSPNGKWVAFVRYRKI